MVARGLRLAGVALPLLLLGCVVEQRDFEALRDQVRIQQRQINDLKARQEEQGLRVDTLNNGFKILGDKAEENARRIDEHRRARRRPASRPLPLAAERRRWPPPRHRPPARAPGPGSRAGVAAAPAAGAPPRRRSRSC